jgi:hypothetical protein
MKPAGVNRRAAVRALTSHRPRCKLQSMIAKTLLPTNTERREKRGRVMRVLASQIAILDNIEWGALFLFRHRQRAFLGVKVFMWAGTDQLPLVAVIWPYHPNGNGKPGILEPHVFGAKTLVPLPGASLVASSRIDDLQVDDLVAVEAGNILLFENHPPTMPVRYSEGRMWFVNLETGELSEQAPGRAVAQIVKWKVVQKVLDLFETVYEFPDVENPPA